jgi:hypothetical protein
MNQIFSAVVSSACFIGIVNILTPAACQAQGSLPSIKSGRCQRSHFARRNQGND